MKTIPALLAPSLPTDPVALLETLLALAIQLLIADNPDLLLPPEIPRLHPPPRLRHARTIVALIRETHYALARYRDVAPRPLASTIDREQAEEDIPF